jgi:hypothetical protein
LDALRKLTVGAAVLFAIAFAATFYVALGTIVISLANWTAKSLGLW